MLIINKINLILFIFVLILLPVIELSILYPQKIEQVGQSLSPWSEGFLDIHHINTGEGDAAFIIMPDGTTMVIDTGDGSDFIFRPQQFKAPRKPDSTRSAGEWQGRYMLARHPNVSEPYIDYALMTHFHADHISALNDVIEEISIHKLIDRDWPTYKTIPDDRNDVLKKYFQIVDQAAELGITMERFEAGRKDQFTLQNNPQQYPEFHIRNLAVNGKAWTGEGGNARFRFSGDEGISENMSSTAVLVHYGHFTYYSGGDILEDMEKVMAWLIGPVDVHVLNHHGSEAHPFFLEILRPSVHIVQVWDSIQPRPNVFKRLLDQTIYSSPRNIFLTNGMWTGRKENLVDWFDEDIANQYEEEFMPALTASQGHVVVRVDPGGDSYHVYMLDDTNEEFVIKSIHGPYRSQT